MSLLLHYLKVVITICRSKYSYSKLSLFLDYTRLTTESIRFHKFRSSSSQSTAAHTATVVGYTFGFFSYAQALALVEEIFIAQQYRFSGNEDMSYILDCGSNIGLSVLYFRLLYPGMPIVAFEPHAATFDVLQRNIQRNKIAGVTLHNIALGEKDAVVSLYTNDGGAFLNMSLLRAPGQEEIGACVQSRRLSSYITGKGAYVKIDTEGAEYAIINELIQSQVIQHVRQIIIECHPVEGEGPDGLIDRLVQQQFSCKHMRHPLYVNAPDTMVRATSEQD